MAYINKINVDGVAYEVKDENALPAAALTEAINTALAQAKESGEFDGAQGSAGPAGNDYTLTEADKQDIAELTAELVPSGGGGASNPYNLLEKIVFEEAVSSVSISAPADYNEFVIVAMAVTADANNNMTVKFLPGGNSYGTTVGALQNVANRKNVIKVERIKGTLPIVSYNVGSSWNPSTVSRTVFTSGATMPNLSDFTEIQISGASAFGVGVTFWVYGR